MSLLAGCAGPDDWRHIVVIWSYNYDPAIIQADGFRTALPFRLVTSHPCVAFWAGRTGLAPPIARVNPANDVANWDEYNEALSAWADR